MTPQARRAAERLVAIVAAVVSGRLESVAVYGAHASGAANGPVHTLAVISGLGFADLEGLARAADGWRREGLATPMLLDSAEVTASLDAFPIELGAVMASYEVVHGRDPFMGLRVDPADLRRACEVQVRSHLLHLREGFLETAGVPAAIGRLVSNSAAPLLLLLANLARLSGESGAGPQELAAFGARITASPASVFAEVLTSVATGGRAADGARLFPSYLAAVEGLAQYVDRWSHQ
jgi:hypothetical protein